MVSGVATSARAAGPAQVEAGRRIYQDGVLPDGRPLVGTRPEGLRLQGAAAACATCHRLSGMGSVEGTGDQAILVPPLAGPVLFEPARWVGLDLDEKHHYVPNLTWRRAMKRPAYDQGTLEVALRAGLNTSGALMGAPMPRYDLDRTSTAALTAYLRTLGAKPDPGAAGEHVEVAVAIAADADPEDARVLLDVLRAWARSPVQYGSKPTGFDKPVRVHAWRLEGAPDMWAKQLDAAYAGRKVFALLSGVGRFEWAPVQAFCERERVPCILPSVDVIPEDRGHFSLYFSPGVSLEAGILAAHFLAQPPKGAVVQLYQDAAGRQAAAELARKLDGAGIRTEDRRFRIIAPAPSVKGLTGDDVVIAWLRPEAVSLLSVALPEGAVADRWFFSETLATPAQLDFPPSWRARVRFVSLDDEVSAQRDVARLRLRRWLDQRKVRSDGDPKVLADAYVAGYLFHAALARIKQEEVRRPVVPLTREHLLEALETLVSRRTDGTKVIDEDLHVAHYGRMSLGPNQRVATRGGSIMRLAASGSNRRVRVGKRITVR